MAGIYLETETLNHNFEEYSYASVEKELAQGIKLMDLEAELAKEEAQKESCEKTKDELTDYQRLLKAYPNEFPVLYRIYKHGIADEDDKKILYQFKNTDYRKPDIVTESDDVADPKGQLELECTLPDGSKFGLSALHRDGAENKLLTGQISFEDEMLEKLNAENFKRIMDFCERCGFSTFGLKIPTHGGMIDAEEKIKELNALLEEYKKQVLDEREKTPSPTKTGENENGEPEYEDPNINIVYEGPVLSAPEAPSLDPDAPKAKAKEEMDLNKFLKGFREFIQKDLHKKPGLSYWEHSTRINGQKMTVFVLYDKEDRENDKNDGRVDPKKPHVHNYIFSYRLYVGQKDDGTFTFGYTTPNGKKIDDVMAGDFIGEIKKAGITHLNLKNLQNVDKMVWMLACAEKGIVPSGVSINQAKADKMIQAAKAKLSVQEFATFERRLMEQLEENAKNKGKELPLSEQAYIKERKNESQKLLETQNDALNTARFEEKFHNFRNAYNNDLKKMAENTIATGVMDTQTGAADAIAAMNAITRTFDMSLGDKCDMDMTLAERFDELMSNPIINEKTGHTISIRLTEHEKRAISMVVSPEKKVKDLSGEDWKRIYNIMFERTYKEAREAIIEVYKKDESSRAHAIDNILINKVWKRASVAYDKVHIRLMSQGAEELKAPKKDGELMYQRPKELTWEYIQEQEKKKKAAEEAAKAAAEASKTTAKPEPTATPTPAPTHTPERSRD